MFSVKSLLFFTTAATLLSSVAGQSWEVMVYEPSAGGTSSCSGGGTTISGGTSDIGNCREVGLGSNAASFNIISDNGPPGAEFVFNLFSDNNCQNNLGEQLGLGACFSGSVVSRRQTMMIQHPGQFNAEMHVKLLVRANDDPAVEIKRSLLLSFLDSDVLHTLRELPKDVPLTVHCSSSFLGKVLVSNRIDNENDPLKLIAPGVNYQLINLLKQFTLQCQSVFKYCSVQHKNGRECLCASSLQEKHQELSWEVPRGDLDTF
ncbi:hypothetical protein C8R44DRAFT_724917 [Mycena epipterygia]|nr:hypothetical protein C8R44DRAFT_724917 [Mycena epipterygia]